MENEKRLIDEFKKEIMNEFIKRCNGNDYNKLTLLRIGETIDRIYEKYRTLPTIDAVEVVHGRWIVVDDGVLIGKGTHFECSKCGTWESWGRLSKYCPNCGAKMDGDGNA